MEQLNINDELSQLSEKYIEILRKINEFIVDQDELIGLALISLLSGGHLLIEGLPGTAKTSVVKALAHISGCTFSRFQCAVDSQPADIIGVKIFDTERKEFVFKKGPVFTQFMLIDELNRLPPRAQSAFIEVMSEQQATIDGETILLEDPFLVIATQNPYEFEGTFPLIEAQKDRFMFSTIITHLDSEGELEIIRREQNGILHWKNYIAQLRPVLNKELIIEFQTKVRDIFIEDKLLAYIRDIIIATRNHSEIELGVSSRASIALVRGSKAIAALEGRQFVTPDDIKWLSFHALPHRIVLKKEAEISGISIIDVIKRMINSIEVP